MRLLVYGSTGQTGRQVVDQGLKQGHIVTAFARHPEDLTFQHDKLRIVQGDVLDFAAVFDAVRDQEAVVCSLGTTVLRQNTIVSDGTRNIIRAMEDHHVRRLLVVSSLGVGDTKDQIAPGWEGFVFKTFFKDFILKNIFEDKEVQEDFVKKSSLDWIIVRPALLTNGPLTGDYKAGFAPTDRTIHGEVSRADLADFLLRNVTDSKFVGQTPALSY